MEMTLDLCVLLHVHIGSRTTIEEVCTCSVSNLTWHVLQQGCFSGMGWLAHRGQHDNSCRGVDRARTGACHGAPDTAMHRAARHSHA